MAPQPTIVLLHGLGDHPASWDRVIALLPQGTPTLAVTLHGLAVHPPAGHAAETFTIADAVIALAAELDAAGLDEVILVGFSIGAMVACQYVLDSPSRVQALLLAAGQVAPHPGWAALQLALLRMLPARLTTAPGFTKHQLLAGMRGIAAADLTARLPDVTVPTIVLCGSRDWENRAASRRFASGIPGAVLRTVPGIGHRLPQRAPEALAAAIAALLAAS